MRFVKLREALIQGPHHRTHLENGYKVDSQSNERECLQRLLQSTLVHKRRTAQRTAAVVVVLRREDERRQPEVAEDPGQRGEVAFVGFHGGQEECREVEEGVDCGLGGGSVCTLERCGARGCLEGEGRR